MLDFFAATPKGFEYALVLELRDLGALNVKETNGGVYFSASLDKAYHILLWSRLAARILLVLHQGNCSSSDELYNTAKEIDWQKLFSEHATFCVDFHGTGGFIKNSQFGALKIKDAIVDSFRDSNLLRPNVDKSEPDIRIDAHFKNNYIRISLNFSGNSLHQRGYRNYSVVAPLKENLAVNVLYRSGFIAEPKPILDPFCGSGTLLIEAALIACNIAPSLLRAEKGHKFGFGGWLGHDEKSWLEQISKARIKAQKGKLGNKLHFYGTDINPDAVEIAKQNAQKAGVSSFISFEEQDALDILSIDEKGYLITNPPYGERLGELSELMHLYFQFGSHLKEQFKGWSISILCSEFELITALKLKYDKAYKMYNGAIECALYRYTIHEHALLQTNKKDSLENNISSEDDINAAIWEKKVAPDFTNRVKKNLKQMQNFAKKEGVDCFRIYDADLPEYNVAIDKYLDYLVVQEYMAPASISPDLSKRRLTDIMLALPDATGIDVENIILKTRERQKGSNQYQRNSEHLELVVNEYGAKFKVDLKAYLDTGLFLDHRLTRKMIGSLADKKDVLNLFAYTGSASVHAALGNAKSVTTIDMSNTYLNWAQENFKLNLLSGVNYKFIQADCLQWLRETDMRYDLIFIDPPTFSNSKRMEDSFDVQRDHVYLILDLLKLLNPQGQIIFSNNKRKFKMDEVVLSTKDIVIENINDKTLPFDYKRNPHIHNTWLIYKKDK